jgi:hypothetical protein
MKTKILIALALLSGTLVFAQNGIIQGRVYNAINNEPLPFAAVIIQGTEIGVSTDIDGRYKIENLTPGLYNIEVQFLGFRTKAVFEIPVTNAKPARVDFPMEEESQQLDEVVVTVQNKFEKPAESPVSVKKLGINEIQRNPGGNQDISRVIQSLPGVASTVAFRNDLIIRGGGPNENRFYLDGIEIPAINHFATQGSSGGPVGMINVNFIRDVDFYTSAFPANRGNMMSSLMEINLKDGRTDRIGGIFQIGASDIGLTLEGPIGKKTTFLASARRSYLQFLFAALQLPFLPTYNDFQFKVKHNIDRKNQLTILGLGAIDNFELNLDANETPEQRYLLNNLPVNEQWNYSIGAKYTNFREKSYTNVVLSRFMLNNTAFKYVNNDPNATQLLDYQSQEIENKLRIENFFRSNRLNYTFGILFEEAKYNTRTVDLRTPADFPPIDYTSDVRLFKWGFFGNVSRSFLENRLDVTLGLRSDAINFNSSMQNLLNQLSPRVAMSYRFTDAFSLNANWGIYYQLPPYTTLGYRDATGALANTDLTYIRSEHFVGGFEYLFSFNGRASIEGFYKKYDNYPFLLPDSISLANLGGDFGVIGNRPATPTSEGRAYGVELTYEQKLFKGFFGIAAITLVRSEFKDKNGDFVPSSWDNRLIATFTFGKKFGKNWEVGAQYQFLGGAPFTPFDEEATALKANWDVYGRGLPDYDQLNTQRLAGFNRLNVRIDKKWFFNRFNLDLYFDIQNALGQSIEGQPNIDVVRDDQGNPVTDPNNPDSYLTTTLPNDIGTVLPTLGVIFEF